MSSDPMAARLAMLRRVGGDKLIHDLIDLMLASTPGKLEAARSALAEANADRLGRLAHGLASSAGNLGVAEMQEASYDLERCAADGAGNLAELLGSLEASWERARELLLQAKGGLSA
jgi:HPt (histidine-containing phosphotransfer) domain-containing protein